MSVVVGVGLTACGSSSSKISVDKLQQTADKVIAAPSTPCPLGFDVNAALKKAGIAATATPGEGADRDTPAVDGESATNAKDDSPFKPRGGALITCSYTLSTGGYLQAMVAGVHNGTAITLMAPLLSHDGHLAISALSSFVTQKFDAGKAVATPDGGLVAVVKLDASGGDVLVQVSTDSADSNADHGPIVGEPLRMLTEALGKQVKI